jgi:hypothetical protein
MEFGVLSSLQLRNLKITSRFRKSKFLQAQNTQNFKGVILNQIYLIKTKAFPVLDWAH